MLVSTLNLFLLAALFYIAHALPFAGFCSAFVVFWLNRSAEDGSKPSFRERLFKLLTLPFWVAFVAFISIPVLSKIEFQRAITPSIFDILMFVGTSAAGIFFAVGMLRSGVQILEKTKKKLTKTTELERNKKTDVREIHKFLPAPAPSFDPLKFMDKDRGVFLGLDEHKNPVYIEFGGGTSAPHVQVIGTTGVGKGVSLGVMASQFLERGEAVFFCDPKNDEWAPSVMYAAAKRMGKPYHYINLNRPHGAQFNIFEGATEDEIFEMLQAGFNLSEKGDNSDVYAVEDKNEASIVAHLIAKNGWTIAEVFEAQSEQVENAKKFYGKLKEMARTPSINAKSGGVSLAKIIDEGGCVYIVGSMRNDIIKTAQRILLVRLIQLAERRDRMSGGELRKICIVLDEVKYHLSRPALEGLGAARDKGVHLVLAHQSLGDLKDCSKDLNPDAVVDAIVENCRVKICYQVQSPDTGKWLASMSGEILVDDESRTVEKNFALSEVVDGKRSIRQAERNFIDDNMLRNLPPSVAILYGAGLPKFVSIRPLRVPKSPEAIQITVAQGSTLQTAAQKLDIQASTPSSAAALFNLPPLDEPPENPFPTAPPEAHVDAPEDARSDSAQDLL